MGLRPGRSFRKIERPYTRISITMPKKSYVVGVPAIKLHQYEMGTKAGEFDSVIFAVADRPVQIRDNAIEAARIVVNKFLDTNLGVTNYFMKILKYPHQIVREKSIATGAGADRYSSGMAHAWGKPAFHAIQTKSGMKLVELRINKQHLETAKKALKKFGLKISTPITIAIGE
ncbi:50S ribosomal protein L16 [archaeon]|nr:MAG: 50S ribosomal protein L16 [archaeon]